MRLFFSFLLLFSLNLWAQQGPQIPALTSPVMDEAGFLSQNEKKNLAEFAYEIHANKGPQITILTVNDLQGYPIEDFSIRIAEKWKLGTKKEGNGLLIIISKNDRQVRIEVGDGIEGEITDYEANQYINQFLVPAFKAGEFYLGLRRVLEDVAEKFKIPAGPESRVIRRAPSRTTGNISKIFPLLLFIMVLGQIFFRNRVARGVFSGLGTAGLGFFFLPGIGLGLIFLFFFGLIFGTVGLNNILYAASQGSGGYRRGGGLGGSGGGGWSGGGGGFSGGGSSGSW